LDRSQQEESEEESENEGDHDHLLSDQDVDESYDANDGDKGVKKGVHSFVMHVLYCSKGGA
jgi:hypothetical protein